MNRQRMVFIGRTPNGNTICDTNPKVLREAQAEALSSLPFEKYREAGHHDVRIKLDGNSAVLSLSERAAKAARRKKILERLDEIDRQCVRPLAAIATGADANAAKHLAALTAEADALRKELG